MKALSFCLFLFVMVMLMPAADAPLFLDSLESRIMARQVESYMEPMPYWVGVRPDHSITLVTTMDVLYFTSSMDFTGVRSAKESGLTSFGMQNAMSPSGTLLVSNPLGKELIKLTDLEASPEKLKGDAGMQFLVGSFSNGDVLLLDTMNSKVWRVGATGSSLLEFPGLFSRSGVPSQVAAVYVDQDDVIWFSRMADRTILAYNQGGRPVTTIQLVPPKEFADTFYLSSNQLMVRPDGSILVSALTGMSNRIHAFARDGSFLWSLAGTEAVSAGTFGYIMGMGFDPDTGVLIQVDMTNKRMSRYLDTAWCKARGIDWTKSPAYDQERFLLDFWGNLAKAKGNKAQQEKLLRQRVAFYREKSNMSMEAQAWSDLLDLDPGMGDAKQALAKLDQRFGVEKIKRSERRARETVARLGPHSAYESYWAAMKQYEELVAAQPENRELKVAMRAFAAFYRDADILKQELPQIDIEGKSINNVFPALMATYRNDPLGTIEVRNSGKSAVENISASIFIKRIMDFPSEGKVVASLAPGASASLSVLASFNTDILDIQEDLQVQAEVTIRYKLGREEQKTTLYLPIRVYKRSALTWKESARLASFITPNEQVVSGFAQLVLAGQKNAPGNRLPGKLREAMAIAEAVGLYGIEYIEDPLSPISKTLGSTEQVDSVRFPRQTLQLRGGDCDDSTALLASLYESVNIETAIMTTPGHVFMAFNTGEPADRAWVYTNGNLKPQVQGGTVWLPVETTVLHKGFSVAVQTAMELVARYTADKVEFIPVQSVRERFPPVPLGLSASSPGEVPAKDVQARMQKTNLALDALWYQPTLARLNASLLAAKGAAALRIYNQIGVLHGTFGRTDTAISWYESGLGTYQDSPVLVANLATIFMNLNRQAQAQSTLEKGLSVKKDSLALNYLMARLLAIQGKTSAGLPYYKTALTLAKDTVADLAPYYDASAASTSRAGIDSLKPLGFFE